MLRYAPSSEQPPLGRTKESLPLDERVLYERFTDSQFIETLVKFLSLEENKGKDRFHPKFFVLFKVLNRKLTYSFQSESGFS
jgi:proteasome activator subunit 4